MRSGSEAPFVRARKRRPASFAALALLVLGGVTRTRNATADGGAIDAGAFDASAPPSGAFTALVGIVIDGQLACTGVLVEARVIVTAASCLPPATSGSSVCLAIAEVCTPAPAAHIDSGGLVAAFVLGADALAEPITYGRGLDTPVAGTAVSLQGYDDPVSLVGTVTASSATTYSAVIGSDADDAQGSFQPTDLGSPLTYTPPAGADGTVTTSVYGVLVTLPAADAGSTVPAIYARLDPLAASFLDPLVQNTRTAPYEGCR